MHVIIQQETQSPFKVRTFSRIEQIHHKKNHSLTVYFGCNPTPRKEKFKTFVYFVQYMANSCCIMDYTVRK